MFSFYPDYGPRKMYGRQLPIVCNVKLTIANKTFYGTGDSRQDAKNDAAKKALNYFSKNKIEVLPNAKCKLKQQNEKNKTRENEGGFKDTYLS